MFVNWKDGSASQFSVADDYHFPPPRRLGWRRRPAVLSVFETSAHIELLLDPRQIKSCYLADVGADQRVTRL